MGIVDFSAASKKSAWLLRPDTLFYAFFYFTSTSSISKFSSFPAISWLAIKRDIGLVFCGNFYRERLARTGSADKPAVRPLLPLLPEAVRSQR